MTREELTFWGMRCLKLRIHRGHYDKEAMDELFRHAMGTYLSRHAFNVCRHVAHCSTKLVVGIAYRQYEAVRLLASDQLPRVSLELL